MHSPTVTSGGTIAGVLLGTAAYMSPEQARGKVTDRRTDIWSFGCVLLECLTGKVQFGGESVSDSIGAVLHKDPDWQALPPDVPPTIRLLLRRCLTRERDDRLHDIADARIELERALQDPEGSELGLARPSAAAASSRPSAMWWGGAAIALLLAASAAWMAKSAPIVARPVVKLSAALAAPEDELNFALTPDGTTLIYSASEPGSEGSDEHKLWLRRLDSFRAAPIPGTENGWYPQVSPDGKSVAFVAYDPRKTGHAADLRIVTLDGRPPLTLAKNAVDHNRPVWLSNEEIAFVNGNDEAEYFAVSRTGGEPRRLVRSEVDRIRFFDLAAVPGGRFLAIPWRRGPAGIVTLLDTRTGLEVDLLQDAENPRFLSDGTLLFLRAGTLLATGIDLSSDPPALSGEVETLMGAEEGASGIDAFETCAAGHLAFVLNAASGDSVLVALDAAGQVTPFAAEPRPYAIAQSVSPDGRRLAFSQQDREDNVSLWIMELDTMAARPVAPEIQPTTAGVWTDDGRLLFTAWDRTYPRLLVSELRSNVEAETVFPDWPDELRIVNPWLATDGRNVLFTAGLADRKDTDIWIRPLDGSAPARALVGTRASESTASVSPDRRWLAYESDESGRNEVYIRGHDAAGETDAPALRVSRSGGHDALWSHDGRKLYFRDEKRRELLVVDVKLAAGRVATGEPRAIADGERLKVKDFYEVMPFQPLPDGRLLFVQGEGESEGTDRIEIVLNWAAQFGR
jgi:Tol biopolymer transport system component